MAKSERDWREKKVRDIMTRLGEHPPVVHVEDLLEDIAQLVVKSRYKRSVYVVDDEGKLVGIIMLPTLLRHMLRGQFGHIDPTAALSRGILDLMFSTVAHDLMKRDVVYLHEDDPVEKAIELMLRRGLKDIPVVNDEMKVVGFVDIPTIIKFVLEHQLL